MNPLDILAERENIYRQLTQTADGASSNLKDSYKSYTIEPSTRYRSITTKIDHERILPLYDSDAQVTSTFNSYTRDVCSIKDVYAFTNQQNSGGGGLNSQVAL